MFISEFSAFLTDMPGHLAMWAAAMGPWIYVLLFAIIFCETGLIVTPFLPGDSLLFALGALTSVTNAAGENVLSYKLLGGLLLAAAIIGDLVNYSVGRWLGLKLFRNPDSKILNPKHLTRTNEFYAKHGGKTVILARFLPILRTYAPFVAGVGRMEFKRFVTFSVTGGVLWIFSFLTAGHFFGNQPQVKKNFHFVILAILVISVAPAVIELIRARRASLQTAATAAKNEKGL